jgi:hypothetical protein
LEIRPGIETVVRKAPPMEDSAKRRWLEDAATRLAVEAATRGISPEELHRELDTALNQLKTNP